MISHGLKAVTSVTTAGTPLAGRQNVAFMEWHPSAADDDLLVTDAASRTLWKCRAAGSAANGESAYVEWKEFGYYTNGIVVSTIDGGTLYIETVV